MASLAEARAAKDKVAEMVKTWPVEVVGVGIGNDLERGYVVTVNIVTDDVVEVDGVPVRIANVGRPRAL